MLNRIHYRIVTIIAFTLGFLSVNAQPPQLIPYQAIARDNAGNPVLNQNIGLRFSIHDQTISGNVVWQESQTVVSNNVGIIVTALGGTTQLTSVDWGSGAKFLQVEMDITGGTNFIDMGTQQMMSVPYALYAETSGSVINNGGGNGSFTHWIGELYGGGIICHLWKDAQGVEHGLIASLVDLVGTFGDFSSLGQVMSNTIPGVFIESDKLYDGSYNSELIYQNSLLGISDQNSYAVGLCKNYSSDGFDDWYLPSIKELEALAKNVFEVNDQLSVINGVDLVGPTTNAEIFLPFVYLSSSSFAFTNASSPYAQGGVYGCDLGFYNQEQPSSSSGIGGKVGLIGDIIKLSIGISGRVRAFRKF